MSEELILSPIEEDLHRSHFHGLLPGQIEYPLGPLDHRLPFPIHFKFILEQRKIVRVETEIGWSHQGIEKLLEHLSLEEGCQIVRRVNPLCPNVIEHFFRLSTGLAPLNPELLKSDIQQYYLYFIREILKSLGENWLLKLSHKDFQVFKNKFLTSQTLQEKLTHIGEISLKQALSYGLTGPTLQACQRGHGDVWSRLVVKLDAISNPDMTQAPEGRLLISALAGRFRIRTPSFAHAAALGVFLKNASLNHLTLILLSLGIVGTEIDR